jgi:dCTP deaminase
MPLLTGPEIARLVKAGELTIEPYNPDQLNPNSYNLRLCDKLLVYEKMMRLHQFLQRRHELWLKWCEDAKRQPGPHTPEVLVDSFAYHHPPQAVPLEPLDMAKDEPVVELTIPKEGMNLWPGVMYLGATLEYTETPNHAPKLDGRSSVGRLGKMIHVTAGFGDVGFKGDWTLEIVVVYPLKVYPGVPICQIAYSTVQGERMEYDGQYQGQRGPKKSGLWRSVQKLLGIN